MLIFFFKNEPVIKSRLNTMSKKQRRRLVMDRLESRMQIGASVLFNRYSSQLGFVNVNVNSAQEARIKNPFASGGSSTNELNKNIAFSSHQSSFAPRSGQGEYTLYFGQGNVEFGINST